VRYVYWWSLWFTDGHRIMEATHNWTLISLAGGAFVLSGMLLAVRRKD
jgi:hypothetical protein